MWWPRERIEKTGLGCSPSSRVCISLRPLSLSVCTRCISPTLSRACTASSPHKDTKPPPLPSFLHQILVIPGKCVRPPRSSLTRPNRTSLLQSQTSSLADEMPVRQVVKTSWMRTRYLRSEPGDSTGRRSSVVPPGYWEVSVPGTGGTEPGDLDRVLSADSQAQTDTR